jgi:hypothetical protein
MSSIYITANRTSTMPFVNQAWLPVIAHAGLQADWVFLERYDATSCEKEVVSSMVLLANRLASFQA